MSAFAPCSHAEPSEFNATGTTRSFHVAPSIPYPSSPVNPTVGFQ